MLKAFNEIGAMSPQETRKSKRGVASNHCVFVSKFYPRMPNIYRVFKKHYTIVDKFYRILKKHSIVDFPEDSDFDFHIEAYIAPSNPFRMEKKLRWVVFV